ncbi:MAG: trypsin-like peptidase domain-containing protein [Candidatus Izimaplasma sp.]|nr:trypsin-like peptidase domain-containing protein [Candidatus Izimaplasma bacterium]
MKKLLLSLVLILSLSLGGCIPEDDDNDDPVGISYTEEELLELIEGLIPEASVDTTYDLLSFQSAIVGMLDEAKSGVVGIISTSSTGVGSGSGVIYKQVGDTYYLVTNEHVVDGAIELTIVFEKNGLLFEINDEDITLLGKDVTTDLAVLTFDSEEVFSVIPMADSYDLEIGEFVFAIGNPLGFDYYGTVTMGVISGLARYVVNGDFNATLLQHDAAISPGNSGGALLNLNGELVGINNMKIVEEDVANIGFAIPSNTVRRITTDLEDDGIITRPYLGITTYAQVNVCGLDYGVCIEVQPGGAAANAELEDFDVIIGYKNAGMDDFLVINNFNDLKEAILNSQVGEEIQLKYIRDGVIYTSDVATLGTHPDD